LIPIALAILLAFLLAPLVNFTDKRRIPRVPSVILIVMLLLAGVGGFGYLLGVQLSDFLENLPHYKENITAKARAFKPGKDSVFSKARVAFTDISKDMEDEETTATKVAEEDEETEVKEDDPELDTYGFAEVSGQMVRGTQAVNDAVSE